MNKPLLLLCFVALSSVSVCLFWPRHQQDIPASQLSILEQKTFPHDHFYHQRSYPEPHIDHQAFADALRAAAEQPAFTRNLTGLSAPWTIQGPGNLGARINTIAIHPGDHRTIYVGFAHGGIWKTTDMGQQWEPVFDEQPFPSIADIAIDPANPETIYAGTGDPNIPHTAHIGDGIYKSTDGGQHWQHLGLSEESIISKISVHPTNPNTLYAGAMGIPSQPGTARGFYKSTDGGQSWRQTLFINDSTGISDFVVHPSDPDIVFAAGWRRIRRQFFSVVWGPGCGLYRSTNGGENWTLLGNGLPRDSVGRIGLAIAQTAPYALYVQVTGKDSQLEGIYKSTDLGNNWVALPASEDNGLSDNALGGFGWYFGKIRLHPERPGHILLLGIDLWESPDNGNFWDRAAPRWWEYIVHADKHDLVFPADDDAPYEYLLATDGGLYALSKSPGGEWIDMENIPATQFYRAALNPFRPENYYGGAQDNGSSGGNQSNINNWPRIWGGDGFQMAFHPQDSNIFLAETQNGGIAITYDGGVNFFDGTYGIDIFDRRNWDMPYFISAHDPNVLYTGTYRVYKGYLSDFDLVWDSISTDLTDGVMTRARYHTVSAITESPLLQGLLYCGTSDGNVWRSDDGGQNWVPIHDGLPNRYVTDLAASPNKENHLYVSHSGYKDNEFTPRLHRSADRGETWQDISPDLPDMPVNSILVFPDYGDSVLFAGTDAGVYASADAGNHWSRLGTGMPLVPVTDLVYNPVQNTLVAATYARSIMTYPLDSLQLEKVDTTNTRVLDPEPAETELAVYPSPTDETLTISFYKPPGFFDAEVRIIDAKGLPVFREIIRRNKQVEKQIAVGHLAPGLYFVKVKMNKVVLSGKFFKAR